MQVFICDDNVVMATQVENAILSLDIPGIEVDVYYSGDSMIRAIERGESAHIYFLDIEMEGSDGITVGKWIRNRNKNAVIIYGTEHKDYVFDVFEALPFRFLQKPFETQKLEGAIKDAIEWMHSSQQFFSYQVERIRHQVAFEDIYYFEGAGRKVLLCQEDDSQEFYGKISQVWEQLNPEIFLRIHNSYIVNMEHISTVETKAVTMKNGAVLPVSKAYSSQVVNKHMDYIIWKSGGGQ